MSATVHEVVKRIHQAERILLMSHVDPDGDAVGSLLGLGHALRRLGKACMLSMPEPVPSKYRFLPESDAITTLPQGAFDLYVSLDCSDTLRLGHLYPVIREAGAPLINIDHHITNNGFGSINWVDAEAAATAVMVVELVSALGITLDRDIALPLLTGIISDTRGFRTPSTNAHALEVASRLMEAGVSLPEVMERTLNTRPYSMICLWGKMLQTTQLEDRIAWAVLTPEMQRSCASYENGDGGFVNFLATAQEADVAVIFQDKGDGSIEVGLRSKPGVNVAEVALNFGGGGHAHAAGCTIQGSLDQVRDMVLHALRARLAHHPASCR